MNQLPKYTKYLNLSHSICISNSSYFRHKKMGFKNYADLSAAMHKLTSAC